VLEQSHAVVKAASGVMVNANCNKTVTISCLQQLYNTAGFVPSSKGNSIGITGYLEQFANNQDLQSFYKEQRPDALGSSYKFISVNGLSQFQKPFLHSIAHAISSGGINDQNLSKAGAEAALDVQFAFGLSHPIPVASSACTNLNSAHVETRPHSTQRQVDQKILSQTL
jgi:tripeptidyl-peptidase-1